LYFLDLNNKTTLAIFRDLRNQERTLSEENSKRRRVQTQLCPESDFVEKKMSVRTLRVLFKDAPFSVIDKTVAHLVEALRYKPEGHGLDFRWCHWKCLWT
jgi:hypothetical protein